MKRSTLSPLPQSFAPTEQKPSDPTPTHTVFGELHQIHAYSSAMRARIGYLTEALGPTVVCEVGRIKREMKDSHRVLEMLQQRVYDDMVAAFLEKTTSEAWKVYQGLVALEAKLRELEPARPNAYVPTGARKLTIAEAKSWSSEGSSSPTPSSITTAQSASLSEADRVPRCSDEKEGVGQAAWSAYTMSGALSPQHTPVRHTVNRTVDLLGGSFSESFDGVPNTGFHRTFNTSSDTTQSRCSSERSGASPNLSKTRDEVAQSCRDEESMGFLPLQDGDGRRRGSVPSYFAAFSIMAGLENPEHFLPKLVYIKVHEVKRLKEWLESKDYLTRSGNVSRTEKLLHLLLLLQDGVRFETIAVMFSRTPRQIEASCKDAFEGLMQMHGETDLPQRQPACDHLWYISYKYFAEGLFLHQAERYYGWWAMDVVKVLVTLNLYIGRYRQQGRVALEGECFEWWKVF